MTTFSQMVSNIASDIKRNDLETQIGTAINRSIRYYYNTNPFFHLTIH